MNNKKSYIQLLPIELSNQIAAGEVVERPSSVLKELIENSLDANSTSISAMIEDGGQSCIQVSDNGKGIVKDELALAVTRHATSKIKNISDLSSISSFGFRGEALPSIASVSRFFLSSCPSSSFFDYEMKKQESQEKIIVPQAYTLEVEFGKHKPIYPSSLQVGTQIIVKDLFTNVPARLKFLKTPATELKRSQEIFTRIALAHTDKAFEFFAGSREVFCFLKEEDLRQRLSKVWAPQITQEMIDVDDKMYEDIHIQGLISNPRSLYSKADKLYLYVNNRPVTDKMLTKAIRQAYKDSLTTKDYPQVVLNIMINPEEVDVNVHPAKSEVRFRDEQRTFKAVYKILEQNLAKKLFFNPERISMASQEYSNPLPISKNPHEEHPSLFEAKPQGFWGNVDRKTNIDNKYFMDSVTHYSNSAKETSVNVHSLSNSEHMFSDKAPSSQPVFSENAPAAFSENIKSESQNKEVILPKYLCQIASSYLLFQTHSKEVFVLDQHAVHERVLFEKLEKNENFSVQKLLIPLEIPLHTEEIQAYEKIYKEIKKLGFECEITDENVLIINAQAIQFKYEATKTFFYEILKNEEVNIKQKFMDAACDAALKAHQNITEQEALELYRQWALCEEPDFCPHGRPCYSIIDEKYLAKMFKRT